jgi:hypothetical protein
MDVVFIFAIFVVAMTFALSHINRETMECMHETFLKTRIDSNDPRLVFDGRTAIVLHTFMDMHRQVLHGVNVLQGLRRICRNEHGEYFLYVSSHPKPYVTHLSKERAKNALRVDPEAFRREFGE